jgi:hypothetical protein
MDFILAIRAGREKDLFSIRRPDRPTVIRRVVRQVGQPTDLTPTACGVSFE